MQQIGKSFQPGVPVLRDIALHVQSGQTVCLLGPSGCGKTTLLRLIAGFEMPDQGEIYLIKRLVSRPGLVVPPEQRHVGMVFQDYALFPHMTVSQNIQFGLFRWPLAWRRTRLAEMLRLVDLEAMARRYPHELSGGQQQRVALARALAPAPQLLLLDEPFSNLDVHLRQQLRAEVQSILAQAGITTILVTHDQEEALSLADMLAVMDQGALVQYATPDEVVRRPCTRFVAQFIGLGHFLRGELHDTWIRTELGSIPYAPALVSPMPGPQVDVLIRPEHVQLCSDHCGTPVQVVHTAFRGSRKLYTLRLASGTTFCALFAAEVVLRTGEAVRVTWQPSDLVVFASADSCVPPAHDRCPRSSTGRAAL
ncbi:MAG: ABC transporter ATP-binding protein [Candidatus Tectomicrobia bacterium]|uniref:ABC transporter ATP-binding protein n=1 Tax=Tectimicrobiota bacterium TaxID=2528274 RepID=A0A937W2S2_UNCTE|nr:ABC transporter ATP-binding protein [Candidatus Tectomicrobia bacterium]